MKKFLIITYCMVAAFVTNAQGPRTEMDFNKGWKFILKDDAAFKAYSFNDAAWRSLELPHDWSIEGRFDSVWPAGNAGGALPGGVGWYRKTFVLPATALQKKVTISFDGVYENSEVWINGHYLGKWPYGYSAFEYELTKYVKPKGQKNVVAVRVDNSQQPNSRWYSGSGIYRDVKLCITNAQAFEPMETFIYCTGINNNSAIFNASSNLLTTATMRSNLYKFHCDIIDASGQRVATAYPKKNRTGEWVFSAAIKTPKLWSVKTPNLYKAVFKAYASGKLIDAYATNFGIRYFDFDKDKGFSLNGQQMKILGVCMHHDLGLLGAAFNTSAARRQLQILKEMGCNAIRTAHNPPASAFLGLCDEMGFLVMDESFDMWAKKKNKFDYHQHFPEWHKKDVEAMVKRDRNHPSVFMWSIGNEIREQFDSTGITLTKELVSIVKALDATRPVTCALSENNPAQNFIYQSKALDVVGLNYHIEAYENFPKNYPGEKFIATENVSGLASRGHYDMPADSLRLWPPSSKYKYVRDGNPDYSVSAYDNVAAYWGSSHEQTWRIIKKHDYLSGLFVWSGFDFIGEPVPYPYPARSSYYGIIDLAGFPKDVYYMYQSEWTDKPVLHLLPHWNWKNGETVDVMAYYNNADKVELFLNGKSLGAKTKNDTAFHVLWKVPYEPGELKAISYNGENKVLQKIVHTAGQPYKLELEVDKKIINKADNELAYITIKVLDKYGHLVPRANNLVELSVTGPAIVEGMDNGYPADLNSMKDARHNVYNGLAIAVIKGSKAGLVRVTISGDGLIPGSATVLVK